MTIGVSLLWNFKLHFLKALMAPLTQSGLYATGRAPWSRPCVPLRRPAHHFPLALFMQHPLAEACPPQTPSHPGLHPCSSLSLKYSPPFCAYSSDFSPIIASGSSLIRSNGFAINSLSNKYPPLPPGGGAHVQSFVLFCLPRYPPSQKGLQFLLHYSYR